MKHLLLIIIQLYWKYIPESKRKRCLFKTSCSNYVYRETKKRGLINGLKALLFRMNNCNSNYSIMEVKQKKLLISSTNKIFIESEINQYIINS